MKRSVAQKIFRVKPVLTVCEIEKLLVARHGTRICQRIKEVVVGVRKVENYCKIIRRTYAFHRRKQLPAAYIGEVVGTGIIGGMLSYPIAAVLMGNQTAALFTFVVPFLISTVGGTIMAIVITMTMKKTKVLAKFQQQINS